MEKNNIFRCFKTLECLIKTSNENKIINTNQIKNYLYQNYGINANRKTIYSDIQTLINLNYDITTINNVGYYINDAPFNIDEIKLLYDAINSSNFLDTAYRLEINKKLLSFISEDQAKELSKYELLLENNNDKTKYYLSSIINALIKGQFILMDGINLIYPYHLHRYNDRYYLIYSYDDNDKLYFKRIDRIKSIDFVDKFKKENDLIKKELIMNILKAQIGMFKSEIYRVHLKIKNLEQIENITNLIYDHFNNINQQNETTFIIDGQKTAIFYSRIAMLGTNVEISEPYELKIDYLKYIENIINQYK